MDSKALWKDAVMAADVNEDEREQLLTWDEDCINGVQWNGGDMSDIHTEADAQLALAGTIAFMRAPGLEWTE